MQNIPYLEKGDTVLIITPAKSIDSNYIEKAIELFNSWGLHVQVGAHAIGSYHYFSGTDKERAEDLQWALNHPTAKAIICARGGYGTIRIIDEVDFSKFNKHPKWMVGFSDITILHSKLNEQLLLPSIHATVPLQFDQLAPESETLSTLKQALFGEPVITHFSSSNFKIGKVVAPVVGGNLAILESLIGTNLDIDTSGKILFIEEISEYAYKLDRMMWSLKKAGKLKNLAGFLVGGLTDIKECEETFGCTAEELVFSFVENENYPVAFNFPAGHQLDNRALVFGTDYLFEVNATSCRMKQI